MNGFPSTTTSTCIPLPELRDALKDCLKEELRDMIRAAIKEEIEVSSIVHRCPLEDIHISAEEHKAHHRTLLRVSKDWQHIRTAFLLGVVTALTGGLIAAMYLGLKLKIIGEQ